MTHAINPPPTVEANVIGASTFCMGSAPVPSTVDEDHVAALAFCRFADKIAERYDRNRTINRGAQAAAIVTVSFRRSPGL